jgi:hypothetical protein
MRCSQSDADAASIIAAIGAAQQNIRKDAEAGRQPVSAAGMGDCSTDTRDQQRYFVHALDFIRRPRHESNSHSDLNASSKECFSLRRRSISSEAFKTGLVSCTIGLRPVISGTRKNLTI